MLRFDFDIDNPRLARRIDAAALEAGDDVTNEVAKRARQIAAQLADSELRSDRAAFERSGSGGGRRYHRGFYVRASRNGSGAAVGNHAEHAAIIERGSRPHDIEGSPKLAFPDTGKFGEGTKGFGRIVVVKRVEHPGTRAYRIIERATIRAMREKGIRVRGGR